MGKGHNFHGGLSSEHLKQFVERIERLEEEKKTIAEDIKEVFAEAKGTGFDARTMREIIKLRKKDPADLEEEEYLLDIYKRALGMLPDLFDEDDNPSIKENSTKITIKTDNGDIKTNLSDIKKAAAEIIANPEKTLKLKSKAIKAVQQIKKCGDDIRKVGREHGASEKTMLELMTKKATEVENKTGLPAEDVLAILTDQTYDEKQK